MISPAAFLQRGSEAAGKGGAEDKERGCLVG